MTRYHGNSGRARLELQDYLKRPRPDGYRAIYLNLRLPVNIGKKRVTLGCEVQIRSLLQDSWAHLSHEDIYKPGGSIPTRLRRTMERLSDLLAVADQLADDIREEISRRYPGRPVKSGTRLGARAIAFLFQRAFGENPPDYLMRATLQACQNKAIRSDGLDAMLRDKQLRETFESAYSQHAPWKPSPEALFRWIVHAAIDGKKSAVRLAAQEGSPAWSEVDSIYKSEVLSDLPETWKSLVVLIENTPNDLDLPIQISEWSEALDASHDCRLCGTRIVDPMAFAEALLKHYRLEGAEADKASEAIVGAVLASGAETGGLDSSTLCNYCEYLLEKD